ncbi:MAG TPA: DinB family protein [Chitinophagaceae bacterium]|nr:DinB family protein [Chitinophagaceae bacterium]
MNAIATELETLIDKYLSQLNSINDTDLSHKSLPAKWSKKELIGHLIDSAQNNIRRFIVARYEEDPTITYQQDNWVAINNYQQWESNHLIQLWYFLNRQMVYILKNIPAEVSQRTCNTGTSYTIEWLAQDYIKHLKHHIHPVLNMEPVAYP